MKELKNSIDNAPLHTEKGNNYEIPVGGSLGLLALGYQGLMAWRHKRAETSNKRDENPSMAQPKE